MTKLRAITLTILSCLLTLCATASSASAQSFDISSGGTPTITGSLGGSVTGSSSSLQNLVVTVNLGELSPANTNNIVRVVVPVAVRSTGAYQVNASITGTINPDPQAVQATDAGFGVINVTRMGTLAPSCNNHLVRAPFNNDPSLTVTTAANGRAAYPSDLSDLLVSNVILSGPRLTTSNSLTRRNDNGYTFNVIIAIKPQFYSTGTSTATIILSIGSGPSVTCN